MLKTIVSKSLFAAWFLLTVAGNVYADAALDNGMKQAIADGDMEKVKSMISVNAGKGAGARKNFPGIKSAMELNIDMFRMLMEEGINVYLDEDPDETEAWLASVDMNLSIFLLLAGNMPPNLIRLNQYYFSVFRQTIFEGHLEVVIKLLDFKFDVNIQDGTGMTPLILAAKEGNFEIVELLLKKGSDVNHKSIYETALMQAVKQGYKNVIQLLLDGQADVNAQVHGGETALWQLIRKTDQANFDLLMDYGADVNIKTRFGNTVLMEAVRLDNIDTVRLLISKGAKINAADELGETPLMKAAEAGQISAVRLLLEMGADVGAKNKSGETALMKAVSKWRNHEILHLLIERGGNINARSNIGQTALTLAADMGITEYVEILRSAGGE